METLYREDSKSKRTQKPLSLKWPKAIAVFFSTDFEKLFKDYKDPWSFETSKFEKDRFTKILSIAKTVPHESILEIGPAEGHLTEKLTKIAKNVTAIEISEAAIKRAKGKAPKAKYINTSFEKFEPGPQKFDLVIASEVFYYFKNGPKMAQKIAKIGKYLITSNAGIHDYLQAKHLTNFKLEKKQIHINIKELKITTIRLYKI